MFKMGWSLLIIRGSSSDLFHEKGLASEGMGGSFDVSEWGGGGVRYGDLGEKGVRRDVGF